MPDMFINSQGPYSYELQMEQSYTNIDMVSSTRPDTEWSTTDSFGHFHAFDAPSGTLPTLRHHTEVEINYLDEREVESLETSWRCRLCNDIVVPNYITGFAKPMVIPTAKQKVTIIVRDYDRTVDHGQELSFHNDALFGLGVVTGIHVKSTMMSPSISVDILARFLAHRTPPTPKSLSE